LKNEKARRKAFDSTISHGTNGIVLDAHTDALAARLEAHPELSALLERERAQFTARIAELKQERDRLRASHERLRQSSSSSSDGCSSRRRSASTRASSS